MCFAWSEQIACGCKQFIQHELHQLTPHNLILKIANPAIYFLASKIKLAHLIHVFVSIYKLWFQSRA